MDIDKLCIRCCNGIIFLCRYICFPLKYLFTCLTNVFERPYSLIFLISFFLLIGPTILLLVLLIQNYMIINSTPGFNFIFYITLLNLVVNYILVFNIYYLYGKHRIEKNNENFTVKTYTKYVINYLFHENKIGFVGIYFLIQIVLNFIFLAKLNQPDYVSDTFDVPVLIYFTYTAVVLNLIFVLFHISFYLFLFIILLCKINNSCLCNVAKKCCEKNAYRYNPDAEFGQPPIENNQIYFNVYFCDKILEMYKLIGLFDYEKEFENINENKKIIRNENV